MTKRIAPLAIVLLLLGAACSKKATPTLTTQPTTSGGGNNVAIQEADFAFTPSAITAANNATLVITNNGPSLHNFSIKGTPIDVDVQPGQSQQLTPPATPLPPGTYDVFCKYHQTVGMVATLTVTAGT